MLDLILTVFRYIFLILLYVFIFQLIRMMFRDLKPEPARKAGVKYVVPSGAVSALPAVAPPPGSTAGLTVLASKDPGLPPGSVFPLKKGEEDTLGRGGHNTVIFTELFASADHAAVRGNDGQFWLEDMGSKNGTYLNDVRINKPTVLADGDRIRIGDVTMQFVRWAYEVESGDRSGSLKEAKRG